MRYFIKLNDLGEKIDFMEKRLDIIHENIENLKLIRDNLTWKGDAADNFCQNYDNYLLKLQIAEQKIINSVLFLTSFYDKYGNEYMRIRNKYANIFDMEVQNGLLS